jgi:hypothetical protein
MSGLLVYLALCLVSLAAIRFFAGMPEAPRD